MALLASEVRGPGIRADIDAAGVEHVGDDRAGHVGEHDARQQLDLLALHELVGDLLALAGLQAVILNDELHGDAAELATLLLDRELKCVANILSEIAAWAGERRDHPDLERLLRLGRQSCQKAEAGRKTRRCKCRCNSHVIPPDRVLSVCPEWPGFFPRSTPSSNWIV